VVAAVFLVLCSGGVSCGVRREAARPSPDERVPLPSPRLEIAQLDLAVSRACAYLLGRAHRQGYWLGTLHNDSSVTGVYILLALYTGQVAPDRQEKALRFLLEEQRPDGGWEQVPGGGGNLDITLINTTALRATGMPARHEAVQRAQAFIREHGGTERANFFTKIFLAMFGQVSWERIPWVTCRWIQSQDFLYRQGYPRVILIPYMVLYENRQVLDLPPFFGEDAEEEEDPVPVPLCGQNRFRQPASRLGFAERWKDPEHRERCIRWILERQEEDGTWAGIVQATAFSAMALKASAREEWEPAIHRAVRGVESYQVVNERSLMQPFSQGPVMDTAHSLRALLHAGVSAGEPTVERAVRWIVGRQILQEGDWKYGNPQGEPGGWPFQFYNRWYPDVDDSAMVLGALSLLDSSSLGPVMPAVERGLGWILSMQNRDGGFPVWDKNNWLIFNVLRSLFDVGDYSHADVTARVLVALGTLKNLEPFSGREEIDETIRAARAFLFRGQMENGSWYGRWGANYTYGTGQVLEGLLVTGSEPEDPPVRKAVAWLFQVQNPDGGWGESVASYETGTFEPGDSSVAQSAAVLAGLLRAGVLEDPRFLNGIRYLLEVQQADGSWQDRVFYAVNVPRAWYGRYELLSTQAALTVLAGYRDRATRTGGVPGKPWGKEEP